MKPTLTTPESKVLRFVGDCILAGVRVRTALIERAVGEKPVNAHLKSLERKGYLREGGISLTRAGLRFVTS